MCGLASGSEGKNLFHSSPGARMSLSGCRSTLTLGFYLVLILTGSCGAEGCDSDVAPLISGGAPAAEGRYPYIVSIQINELHSCAGALISPRWVVTVAGCVGRMKGREQGVRVTIGGINLFDDSCADILDVESISVEPRDGDLALLKLSADSIKQPIRPGFDGVDRGSSPKFSLVGFGRTSETSSFSQTLQEAVQLPLHSTRVCLVLHQITTKRWICAGNRAHACRGDWGSPLIFPSSSVDPSQDQLTGVTIFPNNQIHCGKEQPGLFVDISRNADWIKSFIY